jgi:hypothetical protein
VFNQLITSKKALRILFATSLFTNVFFLLFLATTLIIPEKVFTYASALLHHPVYLSQTVLHVFVGAFSFLFFMVIVGLTLMTKNKKAGYTIYFLFKGIILFFALFVAMNIPNIFFMVGGALFLYIYRMKYIELKKTSNEKLQ